MAGRKKAPRARVVIDEEYLEVLIDKADMLDGFFLHNAKDQTFGIGDITTEHFKGYDAIRKVYDKLPDDAKETAEHQGPTSDGE